MFRIVRRWALALTVAVALAFAVAAGVHGSVAQAAVACRCKALALNNRMHRWLVESGTMHCDRCGPRRPFSAWRLLSGW